MPPILAVLLDIEGTTTPIDFVYKTLFPYVRDRVHEFLDAGGSDPEVQNVVGLLEREKAEEGKASLSTADYVLWLMDQDRKSTGLKALQGRIWFEGSRNGQLRGEVFPDVPSALARWLRAAIDIRIFSSGSILAQQLLFQSTRFGDLTRSLRGYFDTTTGSKADPSSYKRISRAMNVPAASILFVSDTLTELDAAHQAGMQTALCIRPGNRPVSPGHAHRTVSNLTQVLP